MSYATLRRCFENPVGCLYEQPTGYYIVAQYHPGPRQLCDLQTFLTQAGHLLARYNWYKLLGDQRLMAPFSPEEVQWVTSYWLNSTQWRTNVLYGAVLLPHDVFARLSVSQVMSEAKAAAMTYRLFEDDEAAQQWLRNLT